MQTRRYTGRSRQRSLHISISGRFRTISSILSSHANASLALLGGYAGKLNKTSSTLMVGFGIILVGIFLCSFTTCHAPVLVHRGNRTSRVRLHRRTRVSSCSMDLRARRALLEDVVRSQSHLSRVPESSTRPALARNPRLVCPYQVAHTKPSDEDRGDHTCKDAVPGLLKCI